jgi:diaminopimelate decarboxylase
VDKAREILCSDTATQFPFLNFNAIHVHIGSQLGDTKQTETAINIMLGLVAPFPAIRHLNIGGGLPVTYDGRKMPSTEEFAEKVCPPLSQYHVMLEPGRSLVAPAGVLLTRVLYRKEQAGHKMLIVDASMTELMRPALYQAKHLVIPVDRSSCPPQSPMAAGYQEEANNVSEFTIVGPVCETTDVLSKSTMLPDALAVPGTILAIMTAGAYGASMANNYNARPMPPQICVLPDGSVMCSVRRQSFEDLVRDELDVQTPKQRGKGKQQSAVKPSAPKKKTTQMTRSVQGEKKKFAKKAPAAAGKNKKNLKQSAKGRRRQ